MPDPRDWDDRELSSGGYPSDSWDGGPRNWVPWALWALIPLSLGLLWLYLGREGPSPTPPAPIAESEAPSAPEPATGEAPDVEEKVKLPPLVESDPFLRDLLRKLSDHPLLASFLEADDLVRKIVVSVANVAEGTSPKKQLIHIRPEEPFTALATAERVVLDPASYRRYDPAAALFSSLDAAVLAGLYRTLEPLFEEAHAELGLPARGFRETLARAIDVLLAAPVVEGPIRLRAVSVNYAFEDRAIEKLSPAQKHLVRMGPENSRKVQKKLAELKSVLLR
jgi:hypothetical protein